MTEEIQIYFTSGGMFAVDYSEAIEDFINEELKDLDGIMTINDTHIIKRNITHIQHFKIQGAKIDI